MSRDYRAYIEDIIEGCDEIQHYLKSETFESFCNDRMRINAVVRCLEVIGEASRALPESIRSEMPEIPWKKIIAMRNILAHAYFGVDLEIVWSVTQHRIPQLRASAVAYLQKHEEN